jgi:hypothetical protein
LVELPGKAAVQGCQAGRYNAFNLLPANGR